MFACLTIILAETKKKENNEEFKLRNIIQTEVERKKKEKGNLISCTTENALSLHLKVRGKMFSKIAASNLCVIVLIWVSF
jgi:hypothetical protein